MKPRNIGNLLENAQLGQGALRLTLPAGDRREGHSLAGREGRLWTESRTQAPEAPLHSCNTPANGAQTSVTNAPCAKRIELPPASIPYRRGLIRGKELSAYYDQQRPVVWQEYSHTHAQILVLFDSASFSSRCTSAGCTDEQHLSGPLICGLPQGVSHGGHWEREAGFLRLYLESSFLQQFPQKRVSAIFTGRPLPGANREPVLWQLVSTLSFLCAESSPDPKLVEAIGGAFVERLFQVGTSDVSKAPGQMLSPERLKQVDGYIEANMRTVFQVTDLARLVALSTPHFSELFHRSCGLSPMQYVREYRLLKAHQMARSGEHRAGEIASACGFYDVSHLNREFKKFFKYPASCLSSRGSSTLHPEKSWPRPTLGLRGPVNVSRSEQISAALCR